VPMMGRDVNRVQKAAGSGYTSVVLNRRFFETEDEAVAVVSGHGALLNRSALEDGSAEMRH
jgi:hypothetical protein